MSEGVFITKTDWNQFMKRFAKLEEIVKLTLNERNKSTWLTPAEAMHLIGCKESKLKNLRRDGKLHYKTSGSGRNIEYHRKSVEEYVFENSTVMRRA